MKKLQHIIISLFIVNFSTVALADNVEILSADFNKLQSGQWSVSVTLKHDDRGWDHYADNWRIVDEKGKILGDRVLYHPHVNEQPFTRSLSNVNIPDDIKVVYIEAHDKLHGWASERLIVDLGKSTKKQLRVEKK